MKTLLNRIICWMRGHDLQLIEEHDLRDGFISKLLTHTIICCYRCSRCGYETTIGQGDLNFKVKL